MGALPDYLQQSWPTERQLTRYALSVPVRIVSSAGMEFETTCLDISEGGLGAKSHTRLEMGQEIALELQLPGHDTLLRFRAVVRYKGADRCGVEFVTNTPEQRQLILAYGQSLSLRKKPRLTR